MSLRPHMTPTEIREAAQGKQPAEVLRLVTQAGDEYPDAVWRVTRALNLKPSDVAEMEAQYDNA